MRSSRAATLARTHKKKFAVTPEVLRALLARSGRDFPRDLAAPGRVSVARGVVFEAEMARFSNIFALRARAVLTSSDVHETPLKLMRNAHRCFRATTQKRRKIVPRARSMVLDAPNTLGRCSGPV